MGETEGARLRRGLAGLGLTADPEVVGRLIEYARLVRVWNRRFNLISVRDEAQFVERHILDSLAPLPLIEQRGVRTLIDIGSGAGLPGIPLTLAGSSLTTTLLEPNRKKSLFLLETVDILELDRVRVRRARLEEIVPEAEYDCATVRALRWGRRTAEAVRKTLKRGGCLISYRSESQGRLETWGLFDVEEELRVKIPLAGPRKYLFLKPCFT